MILLYRLSDITYKQAFDGISQILAELLNWIPQDDKTLDGYNCYKEKPACTAYQWYKSALWIDGLHIKLGGYSKKKTATNNPDKPDYHWEVNNFVCIEFNPNKSYDRIEVNEVIYYLFSHSSSCTLEECDYSVDYPFKTSEFICKSLKDKVSYNDSRYFGKRHQHGRLKIYNKRKEIKVKQKVDVGHELTRCEFTAKWGGELYFNQVFLSNASDIFDNVSSTGKNIRALYKTLRMLQNYGEDVQEVISFLDLDYRSRSKLLDLLSGNMPCMVFSIKIMLKLLIEYSMKYGFTAHFITDNSTIYIVNGKMKVNMEVSHGKD